MILQFSQYSSFLVRVYETDPQWPLAPTCGHHYNSVAFHMMTKEPQIDRRKKINVFGGASIVAASITMLFWWGFHFKIFGNKIELLRHPEQFGFVLWLITGAFGFGFMLGGAKTGSRTAALYGLLIGIAAVVGALRAAFFGE